MRIVRTLLCALGLVLVAGPAAAQNLLVNPSFELPLAPDWTRQAGSSGAEATETTTVHFGAQSIKLSKGAGSSGFEAWVQCVPITASHSYTWGTWSFVPSGQTGGNAVKVNWCTSCASCSFSTAPNPSTTTNAWEKLIQTTVAPGGVSFAVIVLTATTPDTTAFDGFFDDAFIGQGITPAGLQRFSAD
jgi:hypothetical protein